MIAIVPARSELPLLVTRPVEFARRYWIPLTILLLGALSDAITTLVNLRAYGTEIEVHFVQRWVSDLVGVNAGVPLAKIIQLAFVIFVAAWWRPWCGAILIACGVLYSIAAMNNYFLWL